METHELNQYILMDKKFSSAYLNMIFEDQVERHDHFRRVSLDEFYEILNNAKIIYEMAGSFKEPQKFVDEIKKCKSGTYYSRSMILNYFGNDLSNSKKCSGIIVYKFNFLNKNELKYILSTLIDENNVDFNDVYLNFKRITKNSRGLLLAFPDRYIMCLNKNVYTENTIIHELNHFVQWETGEDILPKVSIPFDYEKSKFLGLADFEVDYFLSNSEFIPHVNDFCYSLRKIKNEENNEKFIKEVLNEIDFFCAIKNLNECKILSSIQNKEALYTVILSKIFDYHFDKVKDCLKNEFN